MYQEARGALLSVIKRDVGGNTMHITAYFGAERRRDMEAHAEVSRIARANRRRRPVWAWLRRGRHLTPRPGLAPARPEPDLATALPQPDPTPAPPELAPAGPPQPDAASTLPLPDLASAPPEPQPTATLPLPALSGAATGHQASPAA